MNKLMGMGLVCALGAGAAGCDGGTTGASGAVTTQDVAADASGTSDEVAGADAAEDSSDDSSGDAAAEIDADAAATEDVPTGTKACYEIQSCVDGCAKATDRSACSSACVAEGTATAQAAYQAMVPCLSTDGPSCAQAYITCVDPSGTKTCSNVVAEIGNCATGGGFGCMLTNAHQVRPEHAAYLAAMAKCVFPCFTACGTDGNCQMKCISTTCQGVISQCVKPPVEIPP